MARATYPKYKKGKYLNWERDLPFPNFFLAHGERGGERGRFPSVVHGISSVEIRRAKN